MIEYGEPIEKDITDIKILVKCSTREDIIVREEQLYCLLDSVDIGSRLYIIVYDGYDYEILSFISIIASNIDKKMLKEKIRSAIEDWKKNE